jgi:hypothetical protein
MTYREWKPKRLVSSGAMTMNEMKESLMIMEETAAEQAPYVDARLEEKINEMRQRIVEWEAEMLPW